MFAKSRGAVSLSLAAVPGQVTDIAQALLAEVRGTEMTPNWSAFAELDTTVYKYRKPDVPGVAYYEFGTSEGGRILVASGRHDSPIPEFSDLGEPLAATLLAKSMEAQRPVAQLHRFSSVDVVAVDPQDQVTTLSGTTEAGRDSSLADYRASIRRSYDAQASQPSELPTPDSQAALDAEWSALYPVRNKDITSDPFDVEPSLAVSDVAWVYHRSLLREHLVWDQHDIDPSADSVCWAGCGSVAWAQVAAYLAFSERWGNPKYQGSGATHLFPNIGTNADSSAVRSLVEELHHVLGSFCWPYTDLSAAPPYNMENVVEWARGKGARINLRTSWGGPAGGDSEAAWQAIRRGDPVILGVGFYTHYNVGVGAGLLNGSRYVWVNNGQGNPNYNGWMRLGDTFYTGIIGSSVPGK